jgi:hypothetical protein
MEIEGEGGYPVFSVRIESLADFVAFMERDVDPTLDRGLAQAQNDAATGQQLCAGLTGPMLGSSKANYEYAQRYPIENLIRYVFTGAAMLDTIDQLTRIYRGAEEMASLTPAQVQGMLSAAYAQKQADYEAWLASNGTRGSDGQRTDL